jgi:hypothetical protein
MNEIRRRRGASDVHIEEGWACVCNWGRENVLGGVIHIYTGKRRMKGGRPEKGQQHNGTHVKQKKGETKQEIKEERK